MKVKPNLASDFQRAAAPAPGTALAPGAATALGRVGFQTGSDVYERSRPDYPAEAIHAMAATTDIRTGSQVLDVAAGTGKLTRQLQAKGARCVAVEPSASMRQVFRRVVPEVPIMAGTAEELPLADNSVDAVVVAQAFHWFDAPRALIDIARVLRSGGGLALIWNERDKTDPVMAELATISRWDKQQPYPPGKDFGALVDASGLFGPVIRTKQSFIQRVDRATFVEQVASRSYVQVLDEAERDELLAEVACFAAKLTEPIALLYDTDLFTAVVR